MDVSLNATTMTDPVAPDRVAPDRVAIDRDLIRKYDVPGPRYTSYPTAPNFSDSFDSKAYQDLLRASVRQQRPLSLYLHLPFCKTLCFYCGCNVTIGRSPARGGAYLDTLDQEITAASRQLQAADRQVVQIHLGGGSPTFYAPDDLRDLLASLDRRFVLHSDCEIGVEVDPRGCTPKHLDALASAGVNRLSVGLQDLDPKVQQAVNRSQSAEMTQAVVAGAHQRGIRSVNVDLIYGLPHQTVAGFAATVERVLDMQPERLAVFNFAYLPSMLPHQRVIDAATLPSADEKLDLLETVFERLTAAGYATVGMDHFAKPDDPLVTALTERTLRRNFQGYSTWGETDLVGFGVSAIGQVGGGFAQNSKDLPSYEAAIAAGRFATCRGLVLSPEDELRQDVIQRLMCQLHLDFADVETRHEIDFEDHFGAELAALRPLADDGLVTLGSRCIDVTPAGQLLVRNIAMVFDAYLGRGRQTFSRTV